MERRSEMDIGVTTGTWKERYLAEQSQNQTSVNLVGASFAELTTARAAERTMGTAGTGTSEGIKAAEQNGSNTKLYMGETYEERLSKITDKNAANAFRIAYAKKMAGSMDYISAISKAYSTGIIGAASFADAFSQYNVITHVGNADISSANWQRNDFPFWKYFQPDTSADALNDWRPVGENPPQTRSDLQRNYSSVGAGKIAVLIPEKLQQKMDTDPDYARQIVAKLQAWKEDYDLWDNTVAASYGYDVAAYQAGKSYVFHLDENGDIRNCTVTGSGRITGPSKEELEQIEAEQARKRRLRVKYIQIMEESAEKRRVQEQEALLYFQSQRLKQDLFL